MTFCRSSFARGAVAAMLATILSVSLIAPGNAQTNSAPPTIPAPVPSASPILIPDTPIPKPTGAPISIVPPQSVSTITLPVTVDIRGLVQQIAGALPTNQNFDGAWTATGEHGIFVKYAVWRDDPVVSLSGDTVTLSLNIFYHFAAAFRVRNGIFTGGYSFHQVASCGLGEPARTAHVTLTYRLNWQNSFHLGVSAAGWNIAYSPCDLTIFNFSGLQFVKPQIEPRVDDATKRLQNLITGYDFRPLVAPLWTAIQQPVDLAGGMLFLHPMQIGVGPLSGSGTVLTDTFSIRATSLVFQTGSRPAPPPAAFPAFPLPTTVTVLPAAGPGGFNVSTIGRLTFTQATAIAKQRIDGMHVSLLGLDSVVSVDRVGGDATLAFARVLLTGGLQGAVYLIGDMTYDAGTNEFRIEHLRLSPDETAAYASPLLTALQDPGFLASIESKLRFDMGPTLANFTSQVNARLASATLGGGFVLHGTLQSVTPTYLAAFPDVCDPVLPPELCVDGVTKSVFAVAVQGNGPLAVVGP